MHMQKFNGIVHTFLGLALLASALVSFGCNAGGQMLTDRGAPPTLGGNHYHQQSYASAAPTSQQHYSPATTPQRQSAAPQSSVAPAQYSQTPSGGGDYYAQQQKLAWGHIHNVPRERVNGKKLTDFLIKAGSTVSGVAMGGDDMRNVAFTGVLGNLAADGIGEGLTQIEAKQLEDKVSELVTYVKTNDQWQGIQGTLHGHALSAAPMGNGRVAVYLRNDRAEGLKDRQPTEIVVQ